MKLPVKISIAVLLVIIVCVLGLLIAVLRMPSVKYLLNMSGYLKPGNFVKSEEYISVKGIPVPVMIYRHPSRKTDLYFVLIHGFTAEAHKHPQIDRMASSLCDATGMTIAVPRIDSFLEKEMNYSHITANIEAVYLSFTEKYRGRYRAFGACLGGTGLLMALRNIPQAVYPQKIFLYGPLIDGKHLVNAINQEKNTRFDIIVKLALSGGMEAFTPEEKDLIHRAMMASGTGPTDESRMRRILGDRLYHDLSVVKFSNAAVEAVTPRGMLDAANRIPDCTYYIMHSKSDQIIPYVEGVNLSKYISGQGGRVRFFGTELVSHTENRVTVTGFFHEALYLVRFFNELFAGDV
jgi:hypothetical protein